MLLLLILVLFFTVARLGELAKLDVGPHWHSREGRSKDTNCGSKELNIWVGSVG
jgi:hypothetical protein